jgi:hypothetical protein
MQKLDCSCESTGADRIRTEYDRDDGAPVLRGRCFVQHLGRAFVPQFIGPRPKAIRFVELPALFAQCRAPM